MCRLLILMLSRVLCLVVHISFGCKKNVNCLIVMSGHSVNPVTFVVVLFEKCRMLAKESLCLHMRVYVSGWGGGGGRGD